MRSAQPQLSRLTCNQEPELNPQKGWLKKKIQASDTKFLKKWQRRFVEVRQSSLAYYKNQQQARTHRTPQHHWLARGPCD